MRNQRRQISFSSTGGALALLCTALWGCCPGAHQIAQPTPPPPKPCPVVEPPEEPPPPPPPKCESLEEKCEAAADTRLAIGDNLATFIPPPGWTYAKEAEQSVTKAPDAKGWLMFTSGESEAPKDVMAAVKKLIARLGADKVRTNFLTDRIKKPQHELQSGGVVIKLWEIDRKSQFGTEPTLQGEPGTLLLAVVPFSQNNVLVGTAFVTTEMGESYAKLVMSSVQSLAALDGSPQAGNSSTEKGAGQ